MKENYNTSDHLNDLRKRPQMYVGEVRLDFISSYLTGYEMAMKIAGVNDPSMPDFSGFREFVRKKYQFFGSSNGWANMILAVTIGFDPTDMHWGDFRNKIISPEQHQRSVTEFFNLLDEYQSTQT